MRRTQREVATVNDIHVATMKDNQTWHDCPYCGKTWKEERPIPGLIHTTRMCEKCEKIK